MSDLREKIREMIQPGVEHLNYELIDVDCYHGKKSLKIIVFIDHANGIKIDDCVTAVSYTHLTLPTILLV